MAVLPGGVESILQGDINCDGVVDAKGALGELFYVGGLEVEQTEPCPDVGTLAAIPGPAGPQGEQGPTGPPGISEFASVKGTAEVEFGTAISAELNEFGSYVVTFGRGLTGCVGVASQGTADGGGFHTRAILNSVHVDNAAYDPSQVIVTFRHQDTGSTVITDFHLIGVC